MDPESREEESKKNEKRQMRCNMVAQDPLSRIDTE